MRFTDRFPRRRKIAQFSQSYGQIGSDVTDTDAGSRLSVVHPKSTPICARLPGFHPVARQGANSGKGATTAFSAALSIFRLRRMASIR